MSSSQLLERVLTAARQLGASDVHLKAGLPPIFRIKGELRTVRDVPAIAREAIAIFAGAKGSSDTFLKDGVLECTGVDLNQPMPGLPTQVLLDYRA